MRSIELTLELLEERATPSSLQIAREITVADVHTTPDESITLLAGKGSGFYAVGKTGGTDSGKTFDIVGTAEVDDRGEFLVTGTLHSVGPDGGEAHGTLTFRNAEGSFTLQLEGPAQTSSAALPKTFNYDVVSATGAYIGMQAEGQIDLSRHAEHGHHDGSLHFHFVK
jgi:hypothetical protein